MNWPTDSAIQMRFEICIVYIDLSVLLGLSLRHAVVLLDLNVYQRQVRVVDPAFTPDGLRVWSLDLFEMAWRMAHCQTILITPPNPQ
jgi:hypothetical protein